MSLRTETREQYQVHETSASRQTLVRWAVGLGAAILALATVTLFVVAILSTPSTPTTDGSFEQSEAIRMAQLAPISGTPFEGAEWSRMQRLAPATDGSWLYAEEQRMKRLAGGG